ncbi:cell division protein FtsZ [Mycoplasma sp. Pen4]|uniref:cell division protein FtsZ n=1 Tax=Mycoplasma sp. Pen4 TaxID=640330 RepID=UPI00165476D9|nr:cell division protein FtsZ [Mycoplasma sp. Pen4]QNM93714.1 cell division protein FtsZ [Mycoplasma sp. Pen4]
MFPINNEQNKASNSTSINLKIIGVGGAGNNAVNMMYDEELLNVEFIVANTDVQALDKSVCINRLPLGKDNKGFGAGSNPEIGAQLANESTEDIKNSLNGADVVIITAGFGGGTGTGASPKIAQIAKESGALTIALVTTPFLYEGKKRTNVANTGIEELKKNVDSYIVLSNERLSEEHPDIPFAESLKLSNITLKNIIFAIHDILNRVGTINIDFADIKHTLTNAGLTIVGLGKATGENRATKAVKKAFEQNLYEHDIKSAKKLLINIQHDKSVTNKEIKSAIQAVHEYLAENGNEYIDDCKIGQEIMETENNAQFFQIAVIASGVSSEIQPENTIDNLESIAITNSQPETEPTIVQDEIISKLEKTQEELGTESFNDLENSKEVVETQELNSYFSIDELSSKDDESDDNLMWFK